jgi:hypothetical protein
MPAHLFLLEIPMKPLKNLVAEHGLLAVFGALMDICCDRARHDHSRDWLRASASLAVCYASLNDLFQPEGTQSHDPEHP